MGGRGKGRKKVRVKVFVLKWLDKGAMSRICAFLVLFGLRFDSDIWSKKKAAKASALTPKMV